MCTAGGDSEVHLSEDEVAVEQNPQDQERLQLCWGCVTRGRCGVKNEPFISVGKEIKHKSVRLGSGGGSAQIRHFSKSSNTTA